jgi:hypothetical protein
MHHSPLLNSQRRAYLTAMLGAASLAACGGGGGSAADNPAPPSGPGAPPAPPAEALKAWQAAAQMDAPGTGQASAPALAVDAQGNALAVWSEVNSERTRVVASHYTPALGWRKAEQIENGNASKLIFLPCLAMNSQGNAIAAWVQVDTGQTKGRVWFNHFSPAVGWSGPQLMGVQNLNTVTSQPQLAMDDTGLAVLVRQHFEDSGEDLGDKKVMQANQFTPGSGWGNAHELGGNLDLVSEESALPQVAIDAKGRAFAVWVHIEPGANAVAQSRILLQRFARSSGVWLGAPETLATLTLTENVHPQIAMNANGQAMVVWRDRAPNPLSVTVTFTGIWAAHFNGSEWSEPQPIEANTSPGDHTVPQVAIDASGNALAVWHRKGFTATSILASYFDGSSWSAVEELQLGDDSHRLEPPQLAMDANGHGMAVWPVSNNEPQRVDQRSVLQARRFVPGSGWSAPERLDNGNTGDTAAPQVALDASGNALAVWRQSDGPISVPASPVAVWANAFK